MAKPRKPDFVHLRVVLLIALDYSSFLSTEFRHRHHIRVRYRAIFIDRISESCNAIASVPLSVPLYPLYLLNQLTSHLNLLHVRRSRHGSQGIEGQGDESD